MSEINTTIEQNLESQNLNPSTTESKKAFEQTNQATEQSQNTLLTTGYGQSVQNPEHYVLEFSDQTLVDQELVQDFKNFAAQNNMSLENAKQMGKFYESYMQKQNSQQSQKYSEQQTALEQQCLNDPEFGGAKLHENLRYAKAALTMFDNGELGKILNSSGFGSHPEIIRFMYRVGKALAEKDLVQGQSTGREPSAAELFYPSMKKSL